MNLVNEEFFDGLVNSSGVLGKYFMDYDYSVRVGVWMEGFDDKYYSGVCFNGIYIFCFRNIEDKYFDFICGYGF